MATVHCKVHVYNHKYFLACSLENVSSLYLMGNVVNILIRYHSASVSYFPEKHAYYYLREFHRWNVENRGHSNLLTNLCDVCVCIYSIYMCVYNVCM